MQETIPESVWIQFQTGDSSETETCCWQILEVTKLRREDSYGEDKKDKDKKTVMMWTSQMRRRL